MYNIEASEMLSYTLDTEHNVARIDPVADDCML